MTRHKLLCHFWNQALIVQQMIVVLGPDFWVAYTPVSCPGSSVVATLCSCIGLEDIILGEFQLINMPSAKALFSSLGFN
jgi:hypothetical protein